MDGVLLLSRVGPLITGASSSQSSGVGRALLVPSVPMEGALVWVKY